MVRIYWKYLSVLIMLLIETVVSIGNLPIIYVCLIPVGILLVGYVPGLLCVDILFPNRSLKGHERAALSLALSAAIVLTAPFVMSAMGFPFFRANVVLTMDVVVGVLMLGSIWRRRRTLSDQVKLPTTSILIGVVCAAVLMVVFGVAVYNLHNFQPTFYITNPSGKLSGYPFRILQRHAYTMELHIVNPSSSVLYGTIKATTAVGTVLWVTSVAVEPHGSWSKMVRLPTNQPVGDQTEGFVLTADHPKLTRTLWVRYSVAL